MPASRQAATLVEANLRTSMAETQKHVLVVDDEPDIGDALKGYLEREGFAVTVCTTRAEALAQYERAHPDLMVLDISLPDGSGLDLLRAAQEAKQRTPAIMLTARGDEVDRIIGLELGADDYVTKPFSPREVVARVRAVIRRSDHPAESAKVQNVLRVGDLEIDIGAHEVRMHGRIADVTATEFKLLRIFAENAGQTFTRGALLDLLHDDGSIFERTLDRHINNLRKKIEPEPDNPTYLVTVYGVGYKMRHA